MENEKYSMVWIFTAVIIVLISVVIADKRNTEKLKYEKNSNSSTIIHNPYN